MRAIGNFRLIKTRSGIIACSVLDWGELLEMKFVLAVVLISLSGILFAPATRDSERGWRWWRVVALLDLDLDSLFFELELGDAFLQDEIDQLSELFQIQRRWSPLPVPTT